MSSVTIDPRIYYHRKPIWLQQWIINLLDCLFSCPHKKLSRIWTPTGRPHQSYVICLNCGKAIPKKLP